MTTLRDHLLAAFVLANLAAMTLSALPMPRKRLEEPVKPRLQRSVATWGAPLVHAGLVEDNDALVAAFVHTSNTMVAARSAVLQPIWRYQALTGTQQSWRMFGEVIPWGGWLQIHTQSADGTWSPRFVDHTDADWMARLLNQDRLRGVRASYSRKHDDRRRQYRRLAQWLARHAAEDFPADTTFRMRYQQLKVPAPAALRQDGLTPGKIFWEETIDLQALR